MASNTPNNGASVKLTADDMVMGGTPRRWLVNAHDFNPNLPVGATIRINEVFTDLNAAIPFIASNACAQEYKNRVTGSGNNSALALNKNREWSTVPKPSAQLNTSANGANVAQDTSIGGFIHQVREMLTRAVTLEARKKPLYGAKSFSDIETATDGSTRFTAVLANGVSYVVTVTPKK